MIAGRYSLEREIGRGGTGPVWLGLDETLRRHVAMKRIGLLPGADETDLARAEREARLSAQLHHPNVVQVFDVAVAEDGITHWLVMEYVDGPSIGELIKQRGRFLPGEARPLLRQVASALLAAHEAGIVHRDVKPSNILIDSQERVKLTDFGIARVTTDPALTQTGLLTGSPAYLAPEVAAGETGGPASDVWALGATAFHMLAGRTPYDINGNMLGALYKIVNDDPPRLAEAGPLAALLEGTMTKDPERRWTMAKVLDFLSGVSAEEPVAAGAPAATGLGSDDRTQVLAAAPGRVHREAKSFARMWWLLIVGLLVLGLVVVVAKLSGGDDPSTPPAAQSAQSSSPTASPTAKPTIDGMEQFIGDYVRLIGEDPAKSWQMLSPDFQRASGGLGDYAEFWDGAHDGQIRTITANADTLVVRYDVKWKGHRNGPTTVLQLSFDGKDYLIDGESTKGFVSED